MTRERFDYSARAAAERLAAEKASDPRARQAHLDLAARFDLLATAIGDVECTQRPDEPPSHRHVSAGLIRF